jgi:hypothetical protein
MAEILDLTGLPLLDLAGGFILDLAGSIPPTPPVPPPFGPPPYSLQVSGTTPYFGVYTTVSGLIVGQTYTASGFVWPVAAAGMNGNLNDIQVVISPGASGGSVTYAEMGSSVPEGTLSSTVMESYNGTVPNWYEPSVIFTAAESSMVLGFWGVPVTGQTSGVFDLTAVSVFPGEATPEYGDGYSPGWAWSGTPGLSPSFYYDRGSIAYSVVNEVLANNLPLGLHAYDPVYYTEPSQYTP